MAMEGNGKWEEWAEEALSFLESKHLLRSLLPIQLIPSHTHETKLDDESLEVFDGLKKWDRSGVEVDVSDSAFQCLITGNFYSKSAGDIINGGSVSEIQQMKKLLLFSSSDYLAIGSHPAVAKAVAKAALEHGMGPRGSPLMCGYNSYHRQLETCLADLTNKEDCLLCPTGFAANMSVLSAIGYIGSFSSTSKAVPEDEKVAIFSDAYNHASIIDGIRLIDRHGSVKTFVYRHSDLAHLEELILNCPLKKKVVVTDTMFSMDGDVVPLIELAKLRRKHGFLLVVDEAHGALVWGENGGGVTEELGCENDVDIYIGALSKGAGCLGGFIACSKKWKQLIQSRGRSFMFSSSLPVPLAAGALAAIRVAKKETWRRRAIWERIREFEALTGIPCTSPNVVLIVGNEENALDISRYMLKRGFHTIAIRPPVVPSHLCRLRISLNAAHTSEDVNNIASAIMEWQALQKGNDKSSAPAAALPAT